MNRSKATHLETDHAAPTLEGQSTALFRHTKREQWGLAMVDADFGTRARLIFQDGRSRTIHRDFFHLLEAVDRPFDVTATIVDSLKSMTGRSAPSTGIRAPRPVNLEEQAAWFRGLFPEGFQGTAYRQKHRGIQGKRPLKRHRDALIAGANALEKGVMQALLRQGDYAGIHKNASEALNTTDLVSAKERKRFAAIAPENHEVLANSLFALLHGASRLELRFDVLVRALEQGLGSAPSWNLATAWLAACFPQKHILVDQKLFTQQARWMAPGLMISERPGGLLYGRLLEMCGRVREELEEGGLAPRDMLDIVTFLQLTLTTSARKAILATRREKANAKPRTVTSNEEVAAA